MIAYKGFNKDGTCKGFLFEEGKTYHEDEAKLCEKGFHACLNPLDCFKYYAPAESEYRVVELDDVSSERNSEDSKVCAKTIKIGAKLDVAKICKLHFKYTKSNCTHDVKAGNDNSAAAGDRGSAAAGDIGSAISRGSASTGISGIAVARGRGCKVCGKRGAILVVAEEEIGYLIDEWKAVIVDGEIIKENTWYSIKNGELVEAE